MIRDLENRSSYGVVIVAAGQGLRSGLTVPKCYWSVGNVPLLIMATFPFVITPQCSEIVWVVPEDKIAISYSIRERWGVDKVKVIVPGGRRRQDSVASGLRALTSNIYGILVHDGARPFLSSSAVVQCMKALENHPAILLARSPTDTIHLKVSNCAQPTTSRASFISAQTPQGFTASLLPELLTSLENPDLNFTDEVTALFHTYGIKAYIIDGERENVKITYPEDLVFFRPLLLKRAREIKKQLCP